MIRVGNILLNREHHTAINIRTARAWHYDAQKATTGVPVSFRLLSHLLLGSGFTNRQLFALLYEEDPSGGPLDTDSVLIILCQNKKTYKLLGLRLTKERLSGSIKYALVENVAR